MGVDENIGSVWTDEEVVHQINTGNNKMRCQFMPCLFLSIYLFNLAYTGASFLQNSVEI